MLSVLNRNKKKRVDGDDSKIWYPGQMVTYAGRQVVPFPACNARLMDYLRFSPSYYKVGPQGGKKEQSYLVDINQRHTQVPLATFWYFAMSRGMFSLYMYLI